MMLWNKTEAPPKTHKDKHSVSLKNNNSYLRLLAHVPTALDLCEALLWGRIWDKRGSAVVSENPTDLCEKHKP